VILLIASFVAGAALGWVRAGRRGGDRLDRIHYAAIHGIAFALAVVIGSVLIGNLAG
jgi:hypothetical protein